MKQEKNKVNSFFHSEKQYFLNAKESIKNFFKSKSGRKLFFAIFFLYLLMIFVFYYQNNYYKLNYKIGEVAKSDIKANVSFSWIDEDIAKKRLAEKIEKAPKIYVLDDSVFNAEKEIFISDIKKAKEFLSKENGKLELRKIWPSVDVTVLDKLTVDKLETISIIGKKILSSFYNNAIVDNFFLAKNNDTNFEIRRKSDGTLVVRKNIIPIKNADNVLYYMIEKYLSGDKQYLKFMNDILRKYVKENVFYDDFLTKNSKREIKNNYVPPKIYISKNEIIVRKGQIIDKTAFGKLKAMYEELKINKFRTFLGFTILLLLLFIASILFIEKYHLKRDQFYLFQFLFMYYFYFLSIVLFLKFFGLELFFIFPFLGFVIITYFLFGYELSLVSVFLYLLLFLVYVNDTRFILYYFISALIFYINIDYMRRRYPTLRAFLKLLFYLFLLIAATYLSTTGSFLSFYKMLFYAALNLILSFFLGYLGTYIFEKVYKITTEVNLAELLDWNHPLLKELMTRAPGTYRHSIIVSELAEQAAKSIGANYMLAKVGGLYHDIGKTKRPSYFIENQMTGPNKHDTLMPTMSARILRNHVSEGVKMGIAAGFGKQLLDIIRQHHGTTLMKYFYIKAKKEAKPDEEVFEKYFRYDGPSPSSKESAIIFLADKVEAVSRVLGNAKFHKIKERISIIFEEAVRSGELYNSSLTFKELDLIKETFVDYFRASMHRRIEYPEDKKEER